MKPCIVRRCLPIPDEYSAHTHQRKYAPTANKTYNNHTSNECTTHIESSGWTYLDESAASNDIKDQCNGRTRQAENISSCHNSNKTDHFHQRQRPLQQTKNFEPQTHHLLNYNPPKTLKIDRRLKQDGGSGSGGFSYRTVTSSSNSNIKSVQTSTNAVTSLHHQDSPCCSAKTKEFSSTIKRVLPPPNESHGNSNGIYKDGGHSHEIPSFTNNQTEQMDDLVYSMCEIQLSGVWKRAYDSSRNQAVSRGNHRDCEVVTQEEETINSSISPHSRTESNENVKSSLNAQREEEDKTNNHDNHSNRSLTDVIEIPTNTPHNTINVACEQLNESSLNRLDHSNENYLTSNIENWLDKVEEYFFSEKLRQQ